MLAKRWTSLLFLVVVIVALAAVAVLAGRQAVANASTPAAVALSAADAPSQQQPAGAYRWNFSAKFVCGHQPPLSDLPGGNFRGEPVVKPANYATDINIHNYNYKEVQIRKKVLLLVETTANGQKVLREPEVATPRAFASIVLGPDFATMDDCNALWAMLYPGTVPPTPMPLLVGYLVILSPIDLDVDVVYTAAVPGLATDKATGISEDVERVNGKRVFVPAGALP